jgi:hypothetical protein
VALHRDAGCTTKRADRDATHGPAGAGVLAHGAYLQVGWVAALCISRQAGSESDGPWARVLLLRPCASRALLATGPAEPGHGGSLARQLPLCRARLELRGRVGWVWWPLLREEHWQSLVNRAKSELRRSLDGRLSCEGRSRISPLRLFAHVVSYQRGLT